jgi:F-type H+-transporting ATPase subunit epsilon
MGKLFHLNIVTPEGIVYNKDILSLIAPSGLGYLGILADHAPLVANLAKGKVTLTDDTHKSTTFEVKGEGFIEVLRNNVTLLVDSRVVIL